MHFRFSLVRSAIPGAGVLGLLALAACGGGGASAPASTVSSMNVAALKYGATALVTINGTGLDSSGFAVSSSACSNMTRLTTAPTASTATTAFYNCTVSGATSGTVIATSNGATAGSQTFSVPEPQVTLNVTNTQGVNGQIVLALSADKTPLTVSNFLAYVNSGFYAGTIFHRVVQNFVVQGGGYTATVNGQLPSSPKATNAGIPVETTGGSNLQWTIAMANTGLPDSTTSQFYINLQDNTQLDGSYSVFGTVTSGQTVVQAMTAAPATCVNNPLDGTKDCLPQPDITITQATQTQ